MPRCDRKWSSSRGKSSPTVATMRTGAKKLAATAKYVAAPPKARSTLPCSVSIESKNTEPTTRMLTSHSSHSSRQSRVAGREQHTGGLGAKRSDSQRSTLDCQPGLQILADKDVQLALDRLRNARPIGDDSVLQRTGTRATPRRVQMTYALRDDALGGGDVVAQDAQDVRNGDIRFALVPAVVIGGQGQRAEADLGLACQLGLLQGGHADDSSAPLPVQQRFRARRELRPLHAHVGAARMHRCSDPLRGLNQDFADLGAEGIGKWDVGDDAVAEKGTEATVRAVDQ